MSKLAGVFAPIVTPFRPSDGEIDEPWIGRHLAYLADHGCDGVIACGTNGEAASMSVAERQRVLEIALAGSGDMPVLAGTGAAALPDAITLTRHAFAAGAAGVMIMPPFYFKRPSEAGVAEWYARLLDAAVPPQGKVFLYHIPQNSGVPFTDTLIATLLARHGETIYGIKDSTGDPAEGRRLRGNFPQLAYFVGNDRLVTEACAGGAAGSITAAANVLPDLVVAVRNAVAGHGDAAASQERLNAARSLLDSFGLQPATKAALSELAGLPETSVRPPQTDLSPAQRDQLAAALAERLPEWRPAAAGNIPTPRSMSR